MADQHISKNISRLVAGIDSISVVRDSLKAHFYSQLTEETPAYIADGSDYSDTESSVPDIEACPIILAMLSSPQVPVAGARPVEYGAKLLGRRAGPGIGAGVHHVSINQPEAKILNNHSSALLAR